MRQQSLAIYRSHLFFFFLNPQLLREGRLEDRIQTRTGQLVSLHLLKRSSEVRGTRLTAASFFVFFLKVCSVFLQTVDFLKCSQLKINKMPSEEFQLTKEVVCRQLLKKVCQWLASYPHFLLYFPYSKKKCCLTLSKSFCNQFIDRNKNFSSAGSCCATSSTDSSIWANQGGGRLLVWSHGKKCSFLPASLTCSSEQ